MLSTVQVSSEQQTVSEALRKTLGSGSHKLNEETASGRIAGWVRGSDLGGRLRC